MFTLGQLQRHIDTLITNGADTESKVKIAVNLGVVSLQLDFTSIFDAGPDDPSIYLGGAERSKDQSPILSLDAYVGLGWAHPIEDYDGLGGDAYPMSIYAPE